MSVDLTGSGSWVDPVVTMGNGDPVSMAEGSLLRQGLQSLADRDSYLKGVLESGVLRVRNVANSTALKNLASPANGDVAILAGGQIYLFQAGAVVGADITGFRYDSTTAAGFWAAPIYYLSTGAGAARRLDISVLPPPNRLVSTFNAFSGSPVALDSSASWQAILAITRTLAVGDVVPMRYVSTVSTADNTYEVQIRLRVVTPSGAAVLDGSTLAVDLYGNNKKVSIATQGTFTATEAGDHDLVVQALIVVGGGPYAVTFRAPSLQGSIIRP